MRRFAIAALLVTAPLALRAQAPAPAHAPGVLFPMRRTTES